MQDEKLCTNAAKSIKEECATQIQNPAFNGTITLSDSEVIQSSVNESGTDFIECSVEETRDKLDFLKTPRSNLKRSHVTECRNDIVSLQDVKITKEDNDNSPNKFSNILRQKIGLCNDEAHSVSSRKSRSSVKSKRNGENEEKTHCAISRRLSSSMKTPTVPYFSKSKLQNVQKWLLENDVERIGTPPFANLSVTPPNGGNYPETPSARKRRSSSVDSEVEKVLVAVYGNDWRQKNVLKKCRTEPRKKPNLPPTKTDAKSQKVATAKKNGNGINCRSARRNILNSGKKNVEKDTFENLGVKEIDLNESQDSDKLVIAKNVNVRRKRRKSNDSEWSGCDSWRTRSNKKKKAEEDETPLSQLAAKLTPARKNPSQANGGKSAAKTPRKTFLASLSVSTPTGRCHPEAQYFKINFKAKKEELVSKLFKLYNCEIFAGKLPENMNFSWNVKLRGTAGFCYNKKITKSTGEVIRTSRVELSTKIVDRADRLRDTLIHELCHAASWVIDGVLDGHGSGWSKWAKMAMTRFPELPPIRRCHNYEIVSKYTYKCTGCGYSINRHSKSIDIERKRCGYCYGVLELFVNRKRRGKKEVPEFDSTRTMRTPNNFALFVKENYHSVKSITASAKHAEIMKVLSQQYALVKHAGTPKAPADR